MKAKKVYEAISDILKPKPPEEVDVTFDEYYKLLDKKGMLTMHYVRSDKENAKIYDKIIRDAFKNKVYPSEVGMQLSDEYNRLASKKRADKYEKINRKRRENRERKARENGSK